MKKIFLYVMSICLFVSTAYAVSNSGIEIYGNGSGAVINVTSDVNSTALMIADEDWSDLVFELDGDHNSGTTPTLDVTIQHSSDNSNWSNLVAFTQITTSDGYERIHINETTTHVLRWVRASVDVGGTSPDYDVLVKMYYRLRK